MIVIVDFDGTLALGNFSEISKREPNAILVERLQALRMSINPIIKIVTARGSRFNLTEDEKKKIYYKDIESWLNKHNVPYDFISFNKEYGSIYIDDMTITPYQEFDGLLSSFTKNKLICTEETVIKHTKNAKAENQWYELAKDIVNVPEVLFCNDELIITKKIKNHRKPYVIEIIDLIDSYKDKEIANYDFTSYLRNISYIEGSSKKTLQTIYNLKKHDGTFFHGDLSTTNVLVTDDAMYCIDSNYKNIFGSYLTDAGKAYFSYVAYEKDFNQAQVLYHTYGSEVLKFAVAEGLRVCKYQPKYISIVNNIAEII